MQIYAAKTWFSRISEPRGKKPIAKQTTWRLGSSIVTMMQAAQARSRHDSTPVRGANSARRRSLVQAKVSAVLMVQLNNATPIISNREKSVTPGILGAAVLWQFIKRSPRIVGGLCLIAGSKKTRKRDIWRSLNGCSIQPSAGACNWRRCP